MKNPLNLLVPTAPGLSRVQIKRLPSTWQWPNKLRFGDNFIIEIPHGGVGDHLFLSHLPELLIQQKLYKHVYISTHSKYNFPDIYNLIWKTNPYVSGTIEKPGWINSGLRPNGSNFLDGIVYQFTRTKPLECSTHPKIYDLDQFNTYQDETYVLIDLQRISNKHRLDVQQIALYLEKQLNNCKHNIKTLYAYECPFITEILKRSPALRALQSQNILHLLGREPGRREHWSRIRHAKHFFCLYSGGANIAAACGTPTTVFCEFRDSAISYRDQQYITVPLT